MTELKQLETELSRQTIIYSTEKDLIKVNNANWEMTKLLVQIRKLKSLTPNFNI